ncbi:MAG TPA: hypothetical protein VIM81_02540 [Gammaproteobacteria bacterium]
MLLRQLLQQSKGSASVLFRDPFKTFGPEQLVKEVIGLANADLEGPRYVVFGVNPGTMEGTGLVGISEELMADLKKAHRLVSALLKPVLHLAFIYDRIDGKLVGALEVDGCDEAPYVVRQDARRLAAGESWIAVNRTLRAGTPADLEQIKSRMARNRRWDVAVGVNGQLGRELMTLEVPGRSDAPSARQKRSVRKTFDWKKAAKDALGTVNTSILRLMHIRDHGPDTAFDERGLDTLIDAYKGPGNELTEADNYYFFEETALKMNLALCNEGEDLLKDVTIELALPRAADFGVVDRVYSDPEGKRPPARSERSSYPEVRAGKEAFLVRASVGDLVPHQSKQAFECALRLVVGPKMEGKRIAVRYTLRARNRSGHCQGRLKLEFRKAAPAIELKLQTEDANSNNPYDTPMPRR